MAKETRPGIPHKAPAELGHSGTPAPQGARLGRAAMQHQIYGSYKATRDGGLVFTYEATCLETAQGATWSAVIKVEGEITGTPSGEILGTADDDYLALLRANVEHSIENKIGVR